MKAIVTLAAGLMIVSTTFAQSSRRSEVKENSTPSNNRKSESVSTERRSSSDNQVTTNTSNRRSGETRSSESVNTQKRTTSEPATDNRTQSVNNNRRTNDNPPTEQRRVESNDSRPQGNNSSSSNVSNRRHVDNQNDRNDNSNSRVYDNRREPNKHQAITQDYNRPAERHHSVVHKSYRPVPVEVRRVKYPYRAPVRTEVIWTVDLSRRYEVYYPHYHSHHYHVGTRLATISAYDAYDFVGEIARVYGRVSETYYSWETDEYFLYLGDYYPYQDFTVVVPGREAREFSRRPERFFEREYIEVTGLVSRFQGKPEMIIRRAEQIGVY